MTLLTLLFTLFHCTGAPAHEYHVSKTNLRYVADRQQLQVEMHLFVDDLEAAMMEAGTPRPRLGTPDEVDESRRYLSAYLDKHFHIEWNGETPPLEILGWELEDDLHGLWIYLAADGVDAPRELTVQNTVLTEYYADQKNIVKLFNGKERMATMLMSRDAPRAGYAK